MADDLTILPDIGPASAKVLVKAGLESFAAIASLKPDELEARLKQAGGLKGRPDYAAIVDAAAAAVKNAANAPNSATAPRNSTGPSGDGGGAGGEGRAVPAAPNPAAKAASKEAQGAGEVVSNTDSQAKATGAEPGAPAQEAGPDGVASRPSRGGGAPATLLQVEIRLGDAKPTELTLDLSAPANPAARTAAVAGLIEAANRAIRTAAGLIVSEPLPAPAAVATERIIVTGPKAGRWRAGRRFGPEPVTFAATADELEAIAADPKLSWSCAAE